MGKSLAGIALGEYMPVDSLVHRLDPRTKLVGLAAALIGIFVSGAPLQVLLNAAGVLTLALLCRVGRRVWASGARRVIWLVLIGAATNAFFHTDGAPVTTFGRELPFTVEGLQRGGLLSAQILLAMMVCMVFAFTTTPVQLSAAIQKCGRALRISRGPLEDFALLLVLAMRFVPILQHELETLVEAQKARGVDFRAGGILSRAGSTAAILGPALTGAFRRGDILATAMVAKGYRRGAVRSEYNPLRFSREDVAGFGCLAGFVLALMLLG
ncbi:MAG: energy-coupling factor transporter transmembrane component T [Thermodesulfobacteriota bacterium]